MRQCLCRKHEIEVFWKEVDTRCPLKKKLLEDRLHCDRSSNVISFSKMVSTHRIKSSLFSFWVLVNDFFFALSNELVQKKELGTGAAIFDHLWIIMRSLFQLFGGLPLICFLTIHTLKSHVLHTYDARIIKYPIALLRSAFSTLKFTTFQVFWFYFCFSIDFCLLSW